MEGRAFFIFRLRKNTPTTSPANRAWQTMRCSQPKNGPFLPYTSAWQAAPADSLSLVHTKPAKAALLTDCRKVVRFLIRRLIAVIHVFRSVDQC